MQKFTSSTNWICPRCENSNNQEITVPELDFTAENTSDMGTDDWVEIVCNQCKMAFTGDVYVYRDGTQFEMKEPDEFSFSGDMPMYDPPSDPYPDAKNTSLMQLSSMIGSQSPVNDRQLTNQRIVAEVNVLESSGSNEPVHLSEDQETGDRFLIYATESGVEVQLHYEGNDLLMTQPQMAELFGVTRQNINLHLNNIYNEGELERKATSKESLHVRLEGGRKVNRNVALYNLDAIISVGYRVSTKQGTMFRKWATEKLVQFATKGFVIDVERLKDPENFDHFRELRELIKEIRASEANVYKEVMRICTLCKDYHSQSGKEKGLFFSTIQNKLHYAVTGMTGAEIRIARADASKANMGLTAWRGDNPTQRDILTAKNFLGEAEIKDLNRFTGMLLDYFEQELDLGRLVVMQDAENKVDKFIQNNERTLLQGRGRVSKADADNHAKAQYAIFKEQQRQLAHDASMKGD